MPCCLAGTKPLSEPVLECCKLDLGNKLQWNVNQNSHIFIKENEFQHVSWKMAAILSQSWCCLDIPLYQYRKFHCWDKTALQLSCLHNGSFCTGQLAFSYWNRQYILKLAQVLVKQSWRIQTKGNKTACIFHGIYFVFRTLVWRQTLQCQ